MGFAVGDRCTVDGYAPEGTVRFVGDHHEKLKPRIGVEFDEEVEKGKGGTFAGHEYFAGKKKCCLLVLPKKVIEAIPSAADIPTTTSEAGAAVRIYPTAVLVVFALILRSGKVDARDRQIFMRTPPLPPPPAPSNPLPLHLLQLISWAPFGCTDFPLLCYLSTGAVMSTPKSAFW